MRLYLKGDYTKTDFYEEFKEIAQKMWFKERKGILLDFSYAWDEDLHLNFYEKVKTSHKDKEGNDIPGYPTEDGEQPKKDIPGYRFVETKKLPNEN
ncbi:hypothetical protein V470_10840 [Streptococcus sp. VT 162]|nr:hypothetical protein V470_10840 [Streptococcus sp. VT 162]